MYNIYIKKIILKLNMSGVTILRNVKYLCFCPLYSDPNNLNPHHVIIMIPKLIIHQRRSTQRSQWVWPEQRVTPPVTGAAAAAADGEWDRRKVGVDIRAIVGINAPHARATERWARANPRWKGRAGEDWINNSCLPEASFQVWFWKYCTGLLMVSCKHAES